jgi:hypothetical protein
VQITRQTKRIGLGGLGLVLVVIALKVLVLRSPAQVTTPPPVVHTPVVHKPVAHKPAVQKPGSHKRVPAVSRHHAASKRHANQKLHLDPTLPAPLRHALSLSRVVVAVLYAPDAPGDAEAVSEARKGAKAAHVGFAMLDVRNEAIARALARQIDGVSDPAVLVVRRPGTVVLKLEGFVDAAVVAQAAANTHP